jgi:hypothetical protein
VTKQNKLRSASGHIQIKADDFETFRKHQLRLNRLFWLVVTGTAVGFGFATGVNLAGCAAKDFAPGRSTRGSELAQYRRRSGAVA